MVGSGNTFWFAPSPTIATEAAVKAAGGPSGDDAGDSSLRILVVDDVPMDRDLAQNLLEHAGHTVDAVADGTCAVSACARNEYDFVLMDVQMPGMDGMESTRQIRALGEAGRNLQIVAMTANLTPREVALYRAAGTNGCLGKPIDRDQLFAMLERWGRPSMGRPNNCVHDLAMLDDVRKMLGSERTRGYLRNLQDNLAGDIWTEEPTGNQNLSRAAHAAVARAGQLGFSELSTVARDLEEAILDSGDAKAALALFNAAVARARPLLAELVQTRPEPEDLAGAADAWGKS